MADDRDKCRSSNGSNNWSSLFNHDKCQKGVNENAVVVADPTEEHIEMEADSDTSCIKAEVEGPQGVSDIGLKPSITSDQMREYWLKKGLSTV